MHVNVTPSEFYDLRQLYAAMDDHCLRTRPLREIVAEVARRLSTSCFLHGGDWDLARSLNGEPTELRVIIPSLGPSDRA